MKSLYFSSESSFWNQESTASMSISCKFTPVAASKPVPKAILSPVPKITSEPEKTAN